MDDRLIDDLRRAWTAQTESEGTALEDGLATRLEQALAQRRTRRRTTGALLVLCIAVAAVALRPIDEGRGPTLAGPGASSGAVPAATRSGPPDHLPTLPRLPTAFRAPRIGAPPEGAGRMTGALPSLPRQFYRGMRTPRASTRTRSIQEESS